MNDKSHVSVEQAMCPVCTTQHDTGALLLDKRLRPSMERTTCTGWQLCPECEARYQDGYIALVECDETKSNVSRDRSKLEDAYRTGNVVHLKVDKWDALFSVPVPCNSDGQPLPLCFVEQGTVAKIQQIVGNHETH